MTAYETIIGLEVHLELATKSKIFCSCTNGSDAEPNTHVCPACCGMPGMLPVANRQVINLGMTAGMMLNCHINRTTTFDKKSYYYPDLPASYQTTQWFAPIAVNGYVTIETEDGPKDIRIKQIHMEEDAGKLVHDNFTYTTLVDFNRTSVPLIEVVSQPDLRSADEAVAYLERLRSLLRFAKVSGARMEKGTMRCDVNLSVRPAGSDVLGVRTEMKNMASIAAIRRAIAYETARHIDAIENGTEELVQETRGWDDDAGKSFSMRNKETAGDYRYFPDPNIMPIVIDDEWYDGIRASLPEFPEVKRERYVEQVGLSDYDADILTQSRAFCDCFEGAMVAGATPKEAANWIITNCAGVLNKRGMTSDELPVPGSALGQLIGLVNDGKVSNANGKRLLESLFDLDAQGESIPEDVAAFAEAEGLLNSSDTGALEAVVAAVIAADPETAQAYRDGREKALNPLFGACMKQLKGKCDTQVLRSLLIAELNK